MKTVFASLALLALAACQSNEEAAPAPEATQAAVAPTPSAPPAPDEARFAELFAEACPEAEPVSTSVCRSLGIGSEGFVCQYGLGEDEYLRNKATLTLGDGEWTLADPEATCPA